MRLARSKERWRLRDEWWGRRNPAVLGLDGFSLTGFGLTRSLTRSLMGAGLGRSPPQPWIFRSVGTCRHSARRRATLWGRLWLLRWPGLRRSMLQLSLHRRLGCGADLRLALLSAAAGLLDSARTPECDVTQSDGDDQVTKRDDLIVRPVQHNGVAERHQHVAVALRSTRRVGGYCGDDLAIGIDSAGILGGHSLIQAYDEGVHSDANRHYTHTANLAVGNGECEEQRVRSHHQPEANRLDPVIGKRDHAERDLQPKRSKEQDPGVETKTYKLANAAERDEHEYDSRADDGDLEEHTDTVVTVAAHWGDSPEVSRVEQGRRVVGCGRASGRAPWMHRWIE